MEDFDSDIAEALAKENQPNYQLLVRKFAI